MNMRSLLAGVLAAHTMLSACTSARNAESSSVGAATVLQVDNQGLADMNVYIYNAGQRIRVGFAGGLRKTDIALPRTVVGGAGDVQFLLDPVGSSRASVTKRIYVEPGDTVSMIIPP